jgi:hypothetical protein
MAVFGKKIAHGENEHSTSVSEVSDTCNHNNFDMRNLDNHFQTVSNYGFHSPVNCPRLIINFHVLPFSFRAVPNVRVLLI